MTCPNCGSTSVAVQTFQENQGAVTTSYSKTKTKEKRHGLLWWLFIGWWWKIIDLFIWILFFPFRAVFHIGRRKKYVSRTRGTETTVNNIVYSTVCTCNNCGYVWRPQDIQPAASTEVIHKR